MISGIGPPHDAGLAWTHVELARYQPHRRDLPVHAPAVPPGLFKMRRRRTSEAFREQPSKLFQLDRPMWVGLVRSPSSGIRPNSGRSRNFHSGDSAADSLRNLPDAQCEQSAFADVGVSTPVRPPVATASRRCLSSPAMNVIESGLMPSFCSRREYLIRETHLARVRQLAVCKRVCRHLPADTSRYASTFGTKRRTRRGRRREGFARL